MELTKRLDGVIDRAIKEKRIVGAVVIASQNGKQVYRRLAGHADREAGQSVKENTIFRMASVTKPVVATAVLVLADRGRISLDAPLTDYLPWFTPHTAQGETPPILIRHLLSHTAGLATEGEEFRRAGVSGGIRNIDITLQDNMKRLAKVPLAYTPGTSWRYSMAIDVLGAVIEAVEGEPLGDSVARLVTAPLGMVDTMFGVADPGRLAAAYADSPEGAERMTSSHLVTAPWRDNVRFEPNRIFNLKAFQSGGAGMAGTAPDFLRLLEVYVAGGAPILSKDMADLAFTDLSGGQVRQDAPGEGFSALGSVIVDPQATDAPGSVGSVRWGGIYGNHWFIDHAEKFALVAFTNTAFEGSDGPFRFEVRDAVYPIG